MPATASFDPLWVPVLSHYDDRPTPRLDQAGVRDHLRHLSPHVTQYLIAGTTGDGWEMPDPVLDDWLDLLTEPGVLGPRHRILIGAFAASTEDVIERARRIERRVGEAALGARYAGLTLCAPVQADADQERIAAHFDAVLEATSSPLAIYQLPQVTRCEIAPETLAGLIAATSRIGLIKDTSGADRIARSGLDLGAARLLRGAEGDYDRVVKPVGPYDGWLLSTANGFAPQLRAIAEAIAAGEAARAARDSANLGRLVTALFELAAPLPAGNPFSNANRAVDHLFAWGRGWRTRSAPRLASGERLPAHFLDAVERCLAEGGYGLGDGYRI